LVRRSGPSVGKIVPVDIAGLRESLVAAGLPREMRNDDPVETLVRWADEADDAGLFNANAMAIATADTNGMPSVRNVLMRDVVDGGLCFYTNYRSQKGVELAGRPFAEALFSWLALERQVRVRGIVERLDSAASDEYFAGRPRGSQLGAHASDQSRVITSREWLDRRYEQIAESFDGRVVGRPDDWGGFRIVPVRIEFWQGRPNRLHDRLLFERVNGAWSTLVLAP